MIDPKTNEVKIADVHSMPFGALAAVHAFLRCDEAIEAIGRDKLLLVMTNFFDDFTVLASKRNSKHVGLVVSFGNSDGTWPKRTKRTLHSERSSTCWGSE